MKKKVFIIGCINLELEELLKVFKTFSIDCVIESRIPVDNDKFYKDLSKIEFIRHLMVNQIDYFNFRQAYETNKVFSSEEKKANWIALKEDFKNAIEIKIAKGFTICILCENHNFHRKMIATNLGFFLSNNGFDVEYICENELFNQEEISSIFGEFGNMSSYFEDRNSPSDYENNCSNNSSKFSCEELGRDELRSWDEDHSGWRGNID
jgi:hypothetical protein